MKNFLNPRQNRKQKRDLKRRINKSTRGSNFTKPKKQ